MEQEYYKRYEPILGVEFKRLIGSGSYGKVFEIASADPLTGIVTTSALKIISIPGDDEQATDTLNSGMDAASASAYYLSCVKNLSNEIQMMNALQGHTNIVDYKDHKIYRQPNNIGWDILIRMELLTPISQYFSQLHAVPRQETIQLGIDICRALELCAKYNIIHRDIKPANIFVSAAGNFKLGDFGVARVADTASGASTRIGTINYMAPEVFHGDKYTRSVDIYSLGLVLYQLLNNNRLPLLPPMPQPITPALREQAQSRRLNGDPLPPPAHADAPLAKIILKACAPDPAHRYSDPAQMRRDLEKLQTQDSGTPVPPTETGTGHPGTENHAPGGRTIVPPVIPPEDTTSGSLRKKNPPPPPPVPAPAPSGNGGKPKKKLPVPVIVVLVVVLVFFALIFFWPSSGSGSYSRSTSSSSRSLSSSAASVESSSVPESEAGSVPGSEQPASTEIPASTEVDAESENHAVASSDSSSSSKPDSSSKPVSSPSSKPDSVSKPASSPSSKQDPAPAPQPDPAPSSKPAASTSHDPTPTNVAWDYDASGSSVVIYGYSGSSDVHHLVIPATLDGKPVVRIYNSAFTGRTELQSVYIPSSVTSIGMSAFEGTSLSSASIGADCDYASDSFPGGCVVTRH